MTQFIIKKIILKQTFKQIGSNIKLYIILLFAQWNENTILTHLKCVLTTLFPTYNQVTSYIFLFSISSFW